MPSKEVASRTKICIVPVCKTISADVPDRIFFVVPESKKIEWLEKVGGDITSIKANKRLYCCENHFDVKRDVEGYDFYKHFGGRIKLLKNAYPSKCLGDNTIIEKEEETTCDEPIDPLSFTGDSSVEDESWNESASDSNKPVTIAARKSEPSESSETEENVVTSDVYTCDEENDSDFGDFSSKIGNTDDQNPHPFPKVKKEQIVPPGEFRSDSNFKNDNYPHCNKMLSTTMLLGRHEKSFHAEDKHKNIACKECHETFITRIEYKKHKLTHNLLEYDCEKCGKLLSSSRSLKRHTQSFHAGNEDTSKNCDIKCELKVDDEINDMEMSCKECSKVFTTRDDYLKHKIIHKKTFECDVCGKVFRTRLNLKAHFPSHMKVKPYLCEICSRPFARANNFRRHKLIHVTDKRFCCESCGKRFPANYLLRQHALHHHNESNPRRIKGKAISDCADCGITLNSPYRLKLHKLRLHNPNNEFMCITCRQTFTTEVLMNQHAMRTHAPEHEYVFKCYICPKKYNEEAALKRHVKLHTDPKRPVTCELCGKSLGRPNRLKPHMRALHNPDNPFKCVICCQTFRDQKILDNHTTQIHEQTILCQYCNKSYSNKRGLQQHIRKFHVNSIDRE